MFSKAKISVPAGLNVIPFRFEVPPENLDWVVCPACRTRQDLHQPDPRAPARLVGFCEGCRGWYLVILDPDASSALMIVLPEDLAFREAWASHGGPDGGD